jgi:hypothetical protein
VQFYNKLYTEQFSWQPKLNGLSFDSIGEVEANWLERVLEEGEKAMNSDKASGLDGYSMAFFQAYWEALKEGIMKLFHDFHVRESLKEV